MPERRRRAGAAEIHLRISAALFLMRCEKWRRAALQRGSVINSCIISENRGNKGEELYCEEAAEWPEE